MEKSFEECLKIKYENILVEVQKIYGVEVQYKLYNNTLPEQYRYFELKGCIVLEKTLAKGSFDFILRPDELDRPYGIGLSMIDNLEIIDQINKNLLAFYEKELG